MPDPGEDRESRFAAWLQDFEKAVQHKDKPALEELFLEDSHWRDLLTFTWDIGSVSGRDAVVDRFIETFDEFGPHSFAPTTRYSGPKVVTRTGREVVEAFFDFETTFGTGTGVVRLVEDEAAPHGLRAWIVMTKLVALAGGPDLRELDRPSGLGFDRTDTRVNWADRRKRSGEFEDREPEVLVVGGGHSGVFAAANLVKLGVDALVVDRFARVGDNWRTRYHSLALHNKTDMVHFPFMAYPSSFPEYMPKDKLANWFEAYVDAMEINYWTGTDFLGGSYDEAEDRWTITVRRADGTERVLHPRHIIMATGGVGGVPNIPTLPGIESFGGDVVHTKHFRSGADYAGKRALVVGVGTSGHDVAYDLNANGATVTMMQRSATSVVNLESANLSYAQYGDGTPMEEADVIASVGFIKPVMKQTYAQLTQFTNGLDEEILTGLRRIGMRLDDGEEGGGWLMKFYARNGGYYINVGCSELLIDGTISLIQSSDVDTFTANGLRKSDGTELEFDVVILATGYMNQQTEVRQLFGEEMAERVGTVSGFDDDGEIKNAWRPTPQKGLWFMVSGFSSARIHAPLVGFQIRADLDGIARRPERLSEGAQAAVPASS